MKQHILIPIFCFCALVVQAQVPTDAIAHYAMNGMADDSSSHSNHGRIIGKVEPATDRFGNPCGALQFDGTTGYITVPSSPSLKRPVNTFTVAVWVKMDANPMSPGRKWLTVCCKSDQSVESVNSPQFRVQSMQDDTKGYNTVSINTDFTEPASENLLLGQWFFYVVRYDGSQVNAFIDGKLAFTFAYAKQLTPNDMPLEIGRDVPGGMEFFCGTMDDLRIFDRALSLAEIAALHKDVSGKAKAPAITIQCPADITRMTLPNKCGIPITYAEPKAASDCGSVTVSRIAGLESEATFPIGTTTVTYQATSTAGNTASCSFVVRVTGSNVPTVQCPQAIVQACDPDACSAIVLYPDPTANSACSPPTLSRTKGLASGAEFPKGETSVTYTATDGSGKTAECSFKVTINDLQKPTVTCPADIKVTCPPNAKSVQAGYSEPVYSDNCPNPTLKRIAGLASNAQFPIGNNTVQYVARDAAGNTACCSFQVIVTQDAELGLQCPPDILVPADQDQCDAAVAFNPAKVTGNLPDATVVQTNGAKSGSKFPVGKHDMQFRATHPSGKQADCSFHITVEDREIPKITCPDDIHMVSAPGTPGANVKYVQPLYSDNCPDPSLTRLSRLPSNALFPVGTTTVTYQVADASGNLATCSFQVTVTQDADLGLRCPRDITVNADPGSCDATVEFRPAILTGDLPDAVVAQVKGGRSGSKFAVGSQVIVYSAAHSSGKSADCSFKVTVKDMEKPVVNCPNDVHLQAKFGSDGAKFTYDDPEFSDNCPGASLSRKEGLASDAIFPIGTSTIVYQAKDAAGNTGTCSFVVTVTESQPELPSKMEKDTIVYQKDIIQVASEKVRVYFYDNQDQDGDTISLNYDGKWFVDHEKIHARKHVLEHNHFVDLVVEPNQVHYLVSKAWNEGKKPTNTLTVEIVDGVSPARIYNLTSTVGKSSAIKIFYKK